MNLTPSTASNILEKYLEENGIAWSCLITNDIIDSLAKQGVDRDVPFFVILLLTLLISLIYGLAVLYTFINDTVTFQKPKKEREQKIRTVQDI